MPSLVFELIKKHVIIWWITIFVSVFGVSLVNANDATTYRSKVTVPILENDIAFARSNAFQTLQKLLLTAAIQDLIGHPLFIESEKLLFRKNPIKPSDYLVSVKVLSELSTKEDFTMEMEGNIQTAGLIETLRRYDLVFKDDPWFPITILYESSLQIPFDDLETRLKLFHINISQKNAVNLSATTWQNRNDKEIIKSLFKLFPKNRIIYLIDTVPEEIVTEKTGSDGTDSNEIVSEVTDSNETVSDETASEEKPKNIKAVRIQIFRKSDLAHIGSMTFNFSVPVEPDLINEKLESMKPRFLSLFSIQSLKHSLYDAGLESTLFLEVDGLIDPYTRSIFENRLLKPNRSIKNYSITKLSSNIVEYRIQSKSNLEKLETYFNEKNPYFYIITEISDFNVLKIETFYRFTQKITDLMPWKGDERVLTMIKEMLLPENQVEPGSTSQSMIPDREPKVNPAFVPNLVEKEPNNDSRNTNSLPSSSLVLGNISSRADEDIFEIQRHLESSTLIVDWIRLGKTALSPQLRLYDSNFNFLNNYNLIGSQDRLSFKFNFPEDPPQKLYIRISDKVGFIQGETGGFKSFHYLLKCHWEGEDVSTDNQTRQPFSRKVSQ